MLHAASWGAALLAALATLAGARPAAAGEAAAETRESLRGYGELEAGLGVTTSPLVGDSVVRPGFQLEFGAGPRLLPVTLGLGAGVWMLDATELRHAEVVLRLQPDWRWVRPFASASVGVAALWLTATDATATVETQQDLALYRGVSVGVDIEAWGRRAYGAAGTGALDLTLGVRGVETGFLSEGQSDAIRIAGPGGAFRIVAPFVALTLTGWS